MKDAATLNKPYDLEHRLLLPGGEEKIVHGRSDIISGERGNTIKIVGTIQDITHFKKAAAHAEQVRYQLQTLFENMQEAFFSVDMVTYQMLQMSKASERVWGYPVSDFFKNPNLWFDLILDEDKPVIEANNSHMHSGEPFMQEYRIMHGNGQVCWLQSTITPTISEGKLVRLDGMTMDITARKEAEMAIADSEKRYRLLFEQNLAGIYRTNPAGKILSCNQAFAAMLGYESPEGLQKVSATDLYFTGQERNDFMNELRSKKKLSNDDFTLRRKDGTALYVIENVSLSRDPVTGDEVCDGIMVVITDRKKAEAQLYQSEKRYRQMVETAQEGIWTIDENEKTNFVNKKMCEILEYSQEEMLGKGLYDFMDEEGRAYAIACMERRKKGARETLDIRYLTKTGRHVWANISANPILDENGKYTGSLAMVTDITERKQQDQLLQQSEANLKTIFNNTESCYILMDPSLHVVSFNKVAANTVRELCGMELTEGIIMPGCFYPHDGTEAETVKKMLAGEIVRYEATQAGLNGVERWFAAKWIAVANEEDQISGIILSCKDITARKVIELEHERITADLVQRNKHLQQFNYIVSHNLRAPVANIMGLIRLFSETPDPAKRDELIPALGASVTGLDGIIRDLNKILAAREQLNERKELIHFTELVENIAGSIAGLVQKENVLLKMDFERAPSIFSIRSFIHSIFYNLILNSIKYHRPDVRPEIIITSDQTEHHLVLTFTDNGKGIDLAHYAKDMFGLYKRFDTKTTGKGMGLFMVKSQVEELGGTIGVESEINNGTIFTVTLPISIRG